MKIFFIFIFLISFKNHLIASTSPDDTQDFRDQCSFNTSEYSSQLSELKNLVSIEIDLEDYRSWATNTLEAMINKDTSILSKYKKRFDARIKSNYTFGHCNHSGRIRLHGDWKDHIELLNQNTLISSLDVSLKNGSIANFVKFKLFLERTRNGDNEIILANLLREIGIISPRTSKVDIILNGKKIKMLIQEKAAKELLESLNRKENFLFEGDERFLFSYKDYKGFQLEQISLSKISNPELMSLGKNNTNIALEKFSNLQSIYMNHANNNPTGYTLDWNKLSNTHKDLIQRWAHYELLLYASNSFHALRPHNRKFYLHPFYEGFEPVYFDGNVMSLEGEWMRLRPNFNAMPYLEIEHFYTLEQLISNVRIKDFYIHSNKENLKSEKELENIFNDILSKISILKNEYLNFKAGSNKREGTQDKDQLPVFLENVSSKLPNSFVIDLASINQIDKGYDINLCKVLTSSCKNLKIGKDELINLFENKKLSMVKSDRPILIIPSKILSTEKRKNISYLNKKINIQYDLDSKIFFDDKKMELNIELLSKNSWVLIIDSDLSNIAIKILSRVTNKKDFFGPTERINKRGLTGCVNVYNSIVDSTSFEVNAENMKCEDSLNIIKSRGQIDKINISNSVADGLDIDFSFLTINDVFIKDSGNDCLDLSYGTYNILQGKLFNCHDKGLSIGESSKFTANTINIMRSINGVSSKDSSISEFNNLNILDSQNCIEIFQKKQEFNGSRVSVKNMNCKTSNPQIDSNSSFLNL